MSAVGRRTHTIILKRALLPSATAKKVGRLKPQPKELPLDPDFECLSHALEPPELAATSAGVRPWTEVRRES